MNRITVKLMIGAALLAIGFGPSAATAELTSELAQQLLKARTQRYIIQSGYYLSVENAHYFRENYGVAGDYIADQSPDDQPAAMAKAVESYRMLVDVMIIEARGRPSEDYILDETTLRGALDVLCPLWLFCD